MSAPAGREEEGVEGVRVRSGLAGEAASLSSEQTQGAGVNVPGPGHFESRDPGVGVGVSWEMASEVRGCGLEVLSSEGLDCWAPRSRAVDEHVVGSNLEGRSRAEAVVQAGRAQRKWDRGLGSGVCLGI